MNGLWIGFFIGMICGAVLVKLLRDAKRKPDSSVVGKLLALPTFCFAGPWLANSVVLKDVQWSHALNYYLPALVCTTALIAATTLFKYVREESPPEGEKKSADG